MLRVALGPESRCERQMLFGQLDLLVACDAFVLDRAYQATWYLDWPSHMRVRLVRHLSTLGHVRARVTSLGEEAAKALLPEFGALRC